MKFYAKSNPPESIQEHTLAALQTLENFKTAYPKVMNEQEWGLVFWAVYYHDFGKLTVSFQNKIRKALGEKLLILNPGERDIPHNFLSGAFINEGWLLKTVPDASSREILYTAIYYHHDRPEDPDLRQYLLEYLNSCVQLQMDLFQAPTVPGVSYIRPDKFRLRYLSQNLILKYNKHDDLLPVPMEVLSSYIKVKGFLNRVDYAASAHINMESLSSQQIGEQTLHYMKATHKLPLRPAQVYMQDHLEDNLVVVAATGSGKTEAALLWINQSKAFYTLPLVVSINAIYQRIKDQIHYKQAAILHSNALSIYFEREKQNQGDDQLPPMQKYQLSRLFAEPLTVCTIDQLFRFVFLYNGSEIQLATLSYSKLIIDEIQAYSPDLIAIILFGLKLITKMGGKFAIITATFPPVLYDFMDKLEIPYLSPACNGNYFYGPLRHRHRITLMQDSGIPLETVLEAGKQKRVLVMLNTVSSAQKIYRMLKQQNADVHLLHSRYIKRDRRLLEAAIQNFAPNQAHRPAACGIWVTTQVVEASLDIDFDLLITDMCTIDQLLQRMGRVYRNREYTDDQPNIIICDSKNGLKYSDKDYGVINYEVYDLSLQAIKHCLNTQQSILLDEYPGHDMKQELIQQVYGESIKRTAYYKTIKENLEILRKQQFYHIKQKTAGQMLRNIDAITVVPQPVWDKYQDDIQRLITISSHADSYEQRFKAKNRLQDYTVSISNYRNLDKIYHPECGFFVCQSGYDFDESTQTGEGFIAMRKNTNGFSEEEQFL